MKKYHTIRREDPRGAQGGGYLTISPNVTWEGRGLKAAKRYYLKGPLELVIDGFIDTRNLPEVLDLCRTAF